MGLKTEGSEPIHTLHCTHVKLISLFKKEYAPLINEDEMTMYEKRKLDKTYFVQKCTVVAEVCKEIFSVML